MKAATWMRAWRDELFANPPQIEIDLEAFKAGKTQPRRTKEMSPADLGIVESDLPALTVRVGRRLKGAGLSSGFRVDLFLGQKHVRSFGVAWRRDPGTFIVSRCARTAVRIQDGSNWIMEIQVGDEARSEATPLVYRPLYSHLNDGGRALLADEVGRVRQVVRSLHRLGLDLEVAEVDPRRCPILFSPGGDAATWLQDVAKVAVARTMCAGLLGSKRWAADARGLLGWSETTFDAFAYAWGWRGIHAVREAALERDLCLRFQRWAEGSGGDCHVVAEDEDGVLRPWVDGQRPDLRVVDRQDVAVIEAKLGLTRHAVRTGLAQAREYGFHLHASGHRWPVMLLLGEPPEDHGVRFAEYVWDTAARLGVGVLVERGATEFSVWHGVPKGLWEGSGDGLVGWLCRGE